ncbi:helix-turn-helix domain-containing protein [Streptomyces caatingaensis]|uniref:HTH cro/C1-type domain-containing protein n=1 Tax=Streptomyces caatingaensis TaxID=1678637 RepID=A0A0K9XN65_9ACTN|nr:helix-turn-helix domain-containing protein [Streptomyces caatingaensis]KNB54142.1 hypothetical protein AC230_06405 [Streptomyces caatingaensis]
MYVRDVRRFHRLLRLRGLSPRELARRIGVPEAVVILMSVGRRDVTLTTARLVADALTVPTRLLFRETAPGEAGRRLAGVQSHRPDDGKTPEQATTPLLPRQRTPGPCRN